MRQRFGVFAAVFLMALTLFVLVLTVNAVKKFKYIGSDPAHPSSIVVRGTGDVFAVPDIAVFSFSVIEKGATVKDAQDKATQKMNASLAVLKTAGIDDKDVKTVDYNATPQYEDTSTKPSICVQNGYCPPPVVNRSISGYEVNQTVEVKVRDVAKAGDLLTKVGATGVSTVSGLDFQVDDQTKLEDQAREKAIADARSNAEKLAKDLDVDLENVIGFNDNSSGPIYYGKAMAAAADSTSASAPTPAPLPQGQNKVTSNVEVTYGIR